jgi:hypothetical protein
VDPIAVADMPETSHSIVAAETKKKHVPVVEFNSRPTPPLVEGKFHLLNMREYNLG